MKTSSFTALAVLLLMQPGFAQSDSEKAKVRNEEIKPAVPTETAAVAKPASEPSLSIPGLNAEQDFAFTLALFRQTSAKFSPKDLPNAVLCPGGVVRLLQALHAGSTGSTQKQIAGALKFDPKGAHATAPTLPAVMKQASAAWTDPSNKLKPAFQQSIKTALAATAESVPLQKDPEVARKTINSWAADHTGGNIKELLKPGDMKGARLVLTDAAWFKDSWRAGFKAERSVTADFTFPDGKKQPARFVADRRKALYAKTALAEVVAIPFASARYQCVCLLPLLLKDSNELPAAALLRLERKLEPGLLSDLFATLAEKEIDLRLPKLDLQDLATNIKPLLQSLGIKDLFTDAADLSPMCEGGKDLKVGAFKQVAAFKLDEQGAEAAAATAVVVITKSAVIRPEVVVFHADRPCLFLIRDLEASTLALIVRCTAPMSAQGKEPATNTK